MTKPEAETPKSRPYAGASRGWLRFAKIAYVLLLSLVCAPLLGSVNNHIPVLFLGFAVSMIPFVVYFVTNRLWVGPAAFWVLELCAILAIYANGDHEIHGSVLACMAIFLHSLLVLALLWPARYLDRQALERKTALRLNLAPPILLLLAVVWP